MSKNSKSLVLYLFSNGILTGTGAKGRTTGDKEKESRRRQERKAAGTVSGTDLQGTWSKELTRGRRARTENRVSRR